MKTCCTACDQMKTTRFENRRLYQREFIVEGKTYRGYALDPARLTQRRIERVLALNGVC